MAKVRANRGKSPVDGQTDRPLALVPHGKPRHPTPRLNSLRSIRRELASVYRLARRGELALADACKLGYLLSTLGKLSESELLEDRLARLEHTLEDAHGSERP